MCLIKIYILGITNKDIHSLTIKFLLISALVFHFDISGNKVNDEHLLNKTLISITFCVFHFDISGKHNKLEHL